MGEKINFCQRCGHELGQKEVANRVRPWCPSCGYVVFREVKEETGLDVDLDAFVGLYSGQDSPVVLAVYSAHVVSGSLEAGAEVQEVRLFPLDELPPLPFPHDDQILRDWRALSNDVD